MDRETASVFLTQHALPNAADIHHPRMFGYHIVSQASADEWKSRTNKRINNSFQYQVPSSAMSHYVAVNDNGIIACQRHNGQGDIDKTVWNRVADYNDCGAHNLHLCGIAQTFADIGLAFGEMDYQLNLHIWSNQKSVNSVVNGHIQPAYLSVKYEKGPFGIPLCGLSAISNALKHREIIGTTVDLMSEANFYGEVVGHWQTKNDFHYLFTAFNYQAKQWFFRDVLKQEDFTNKALRQQGWL